ncbi:hypothetical protein EDB83DRAFT_2312076 [Lactarius deliciosus]|nr:hypothetical protein EDB83DRAFT_2312076 [Lactarius deliciosus]
MVGEVQGALHCLQLNNGDSKVKTKATPNDNNYDGADDYNDYDGADNYNNNDNNDNNDTSHTTHDATHNGTRTQRQAMSLYRGVVTTLSFPTSGGPCWPVGRLEPVPTDDNRSHN